MEPHDLCMAQKGPWICFFVSAHKEKEKEN